MPSAADVASWMRDEMERTGGTLYQAQAAFQILERFGKEFTYTNPEGGVSISRKVLMGFRKLTPDDVVWVRPDHYWRKRHGGDPPGRQVDW